jgi:hypothetical protein
MAGCVCCINGARNIIRPAISYFSNYFTVGFLTANVLPFGAAVNTPSINAFVCSNVGSFNISEADMIKSPKMS